MAMLAMRGWDVGSRAAVVEVEGRQRSREACTERKTTSRAALRHTHERSWEKEMPGRKRAVKSPEERRGKVQCHGNQRGSTVHLQEEAAAGQQGGAGGGKSRPPAPRARAGHDLSQLRTDFSKLHGNWKTRGRLSGRCTDSGGNAGRPHISGFGRERRGMGGGGTVRTRGDARHGEMLAWAARRLGRAREEAAENSEGGQVVGVHQARQES